MTSILPLWTIIDRRDGGIYGRRRSRAEAVRSRDAAPWELAQHLDVVPPKMTLPEYLDYRRDLRREAVAARLRSPAPVPGFPAWEAIWSVRDEVVRLICHDDACPGPLPTDAAVSSLVGASAHRDESDGSVDGWSELTYRVPSIEQDWSEG